MITFLYSFSFFFPIFLVFSERNILARWKALVGFKVRERFLFIPLLFFLSFWGAFFRKLLHYSLSIEGRRCDGSLRLEIITFDSSPPGRFTYFITFRGHAFDVDLWATNTFAVRRNHEECEVGEFSLESFFAACSKEYFRQGKLFKIDLQETFGMSTSFSFFFLFCLFGTRRRIIAQNVSLSLRMS